jgi:hypothetical protein
MFYDNEVFEQMCEEHNVTTSEKNRIEYLFAEDAAEALENLLQSEDDFEVGNYRAIKETAIDDVLANELSGDPYVLGSFSAWALADVLDLSTRFVEKIQAAGLYQEIGEELTDAQIAQLAETLISHDGYGHHFSSHDHSQEELTFDGDTWYVFRVN